MINAEVSVLAFKSAFNLYQPASLKRDEKTSVGFAFFLCYVEKKRLFLKLRRSEGKSEAQFLLRSPPASCLSVETLVVKKYQPRK